jgi:hypothetical protein
MKRSGCSNYSKQAEIQDSKRCVVTGSKIYDICHIVPRELENPTYEEVTARKNIDEPENLILLTPTLRRAFDNFQLDFIKFSYRDYIVCFLLMILYLINIMAK